MCIFSGFASKKQEYDYQNKVNRMMLLIIDQLVLQIQLNSVINRQFFDKHFYKLFNDLKEIEIHKVSPPKFSVMLVPLQQKLQNQGLCRLIEPPKLELDSTYKTHYSQEKRPISHSMQRQSKYNPVARICKGSQKRKEPDSTFSEQFYDFQNETQVSGKKTQSSYRKSYFDAITLFQSPKSLEHQQHLSLV